MSNEKIVKVVILGSSGVGKSSILRRYVSNEFENNEQTTLGAAFQSKSLLHKGQMYKFQIWDTAGQEKYAPLAHMYYRDAQVALMVYDITNADSFATLKDWYREVSNKGPSNLVLAIVGNKIDLIEHEEIDRETARSYAEQIKALYKVTSAKENRGIEEMFEKIVEKLEDAKERLDDSPVKPAKADRHQLNKNSNYDPKKSGGCC